MVLNRKDHDIVHEQFQSGLYPDYYFNGRLDLPWESMSDIYGIMAMLLVSAHIAHVIIFCIRSHPSCRNWWKQLSEVVKTVGIQVGVMVTQGGSNSGGHSNPIFHFLKP